MDKKKWLWTAGGFVVGFIFGAVVTAMVTPWSGDEARSKLGLSELPPDKKLKRLKELIDGENQKKPLSDQ